MNTTDNGLLLTGLDGGLLLGFLAALGAFRTADKIWPGTRLRWLVHEGGFRPALHLCADQEVSPEEFVDRLHEVLARGTEQPVFTCAKSIRFTPGKFRKLCALAVEKREEDPDRAAFLAAFATGGAVDKDGEVQDTAFRTMRGSGGQHFLHTMAQLAKQTTREQVENSLFHAWRRSDERLGLRFDVLEDRRYALRWSDPGKCTPMTERGANRLAVEALPLFPVHTVGARAQTTGFTDAVLTWPIWDAPLTLPTVSSLLGLAELQEKSPAVLTWPIWDAPLTLPTVSFLLGLAELQEKSPDRSVLGQRGIVEIYRCSRITVGKYRNFTPARTV